MPRELNPELFGTPKPTQEATAAPTTTPKWLKEEDGKVLGLRLEAIRKKLKELEAAIETQNGRSKDGQEGLKARFERIQQHLQRQDSQMQANTQEMHTKLAKLASRLNERLTSDQKLKSSWIVSSRCCRALKCVFHKCKKLSRNKNLCWPPPGQN